MVIVPPKYSEKTKESKLLVRSFKHIYKIAGLGIAAGMSGLLSLSMFQQDTKVPVDFREAQQIDLQDMDEGFQASVEKSGSGEDIAAEASEPTLAPEPAPEAGQEFDVLEESLELAQRKIEVSEASPASVSGSPMFDSGDLAVTFVIIAVMLGGLAAFFFWKSFKQSKQKQLA
jgi:hypothetical protein